MQQIEVLESDELQSFVDEESLRRFRDRALRPDQPKVRRQRKTRMSIFRGGKLVIASMMLFESSGKKLEQLKILRVGISTV